MKYTAKNMPAWCPWNPSAVKYFPGSRPSWNLWLYSTNLIARNTHEKARVRLMSRLVSLVLLICAERTARAIVRLEQISTTVLTAPITRSRW